MSSKYTAQELLDWVEVFYFNQRNTMDEENEPLFCVFGEGKPNSEDDRIGVPHGFETASEVSKRRITYYDFSVKKCVADKALYYGFEDDVNLADLELLAANYYPDVIGRSLDKCFVIIGRKKNAAHTPNPETGYSPEQIERTEEWLTTIKPLINGEHILIIRGDDDYVEDFVHSDKFLDDNGEFNYKLILKYLPIIYGGERVNIPISTVHYFASREITRTFRSKSGDMVVLSKEILL